MMLFKGIVTMLGFIALSMMVVVSIVIAESIVDRPASIATRPQLSREQSVNAEEDARIRLNFVHHDFTNVNDQR